MTRRHYQPKKGDHRGYPLGGGYIHPAADLHHRRQQEKRDAEFADALDRSGRHDEFHRVLAGMRAVRGAYRAQIGEQPPPLDALVTLRFHHAQDVYHRIRDEIDGGTL